MTSVGSGVREIWLRHESGVFRVIYIATLREAVYVLHVFQKKAQETAKRDLSIATKRLQQISEGRVG